MTLRANLESPATRWPTIAVLITSGMLLVLLAVMLLSIPAMMVGAADLFVSWMPYLYGIPIGATVLSAIVLQRRTSSDAEHPHRAPSASSTSSTALPHTQHRNR